MDFVNTSVPSENTAAFITDFWRSEVFFEIQDDLLFDDNRYQ